MRYLIKSLSIILLLVLSSSFRVKYPNITHTISIKIENIRNTKGTMQLQLYQSQKAFAAETPYKTIRISKENVSDNTLYYKIKGLAQNTYGVALLDDENNNKEMDYGLFFPVEGFGFSDYYHTGWSKPTFHDFKFFLKKDKTVRMKVRYM
tara:strand:- start:5845 stop:6294 length:450 start_codon:yes stop_codon:yes gene_type:complete